MQKNKQALTLYEPRTLAVPPAPEPVSHDAMVQIIWRQRRVVMVALAASLLIGALYLVTAKRLYTGESRLYVEQSGPKLIKDGETRVSENYLNTQCELINSTPILALALSTPEVRAIPSLEKINTVWLKKELLVEPGKHDDIITVSLELPDAVGASTLVNAIVNSYVTYQTNHRRDTANEALAILSAEKQKRDEELQAKVHQLFELKESAGTLSFDNDRGNPILQRLASLSEALTAARMETVNAKSDYEEARRILGNDPEKLKQVEHQQNLSGVAVASVAEANLIRSQLFAMQQQLEDLKRQYMPEHPLVRTQQLRVDQLTVAYVAAAYQRWNTSKLREESLQQAFDAQQKLALEQSTKAAQYARLDAEVKRLQQVSDGLETRMRELSLQGASVLDINVLETAHPDTHATSPNIMRVLVLALVVGLVLGIISAFIRDWMDQRMRSLDEVKATLGMPVLGTVPQMPGVLSPQMRGTRVQLEPTSDVAEAYRNIRTAVYFGLTEGRAKTVLITSPSAGDGKSTLASNLAIAMAQAGQRVLLIDADFRDPTQHKTFEVYDAVGLSSVLCAGFSIDKATRPTAVSGLDLLPCGPIPRNPSEILNSQGFNDILGDLAAKYDQILLDSPPVLAVTDARIASAACEVTLLVLNAERSSRKTAELARDSLLAVGANILGIVVNDVPQNGNGEGFHSKYGYYGHADAKDNDRSSGAVRQIQKSFSGLKLVNQSGGRA
jgi:capsular exopolysaccharide synthesis family protein